MYCRPVGRTEVLIDASLQSAKDQAFAPPGSGQAAPGTDKPEDAARLQELAAALAPTSDA